MSCIRVLSVGLVVGLLLLLGAAAGLPAHAAWVDATGTQFQVGGTLRTITPTNAGTPFLDPTCGPEGGTSLALVPGFKLAGVDPIQNPVVLVASCLDGLSATVRSRLNFISPTDG